MTHEQIANLRERVLIYQANGQRSDADYLDECLDEIERLQNRIGHLCRDAHTVAIARDEKTQTLQETIERQSRTMAEAVMELRPFSKVYNVASAQNIDRAIALLERNPAT